MVDLADGHVAALDKLELGLHIYNLGIGQGTSVLQLVKAFEEAIASVIKEILIITEKSKRAIEDHIEESIINEKS